MEARFTISHLLTFGFLATTLLTFTCLALHSSAGLYA